MMKALIIRLANLLHYSDCGGEEFARIELFGVFAYGLTHGAGIFETQSPLFTYARRREATRSVTKFGVSEKRRTLQGERHSEFFPGFAGRHPSLNALPEIDMAESVRRRTSITAAAATSVRR